jgi:hypothetical protein
MTSILEFPPTSIASAKSWTKDTNDTITGIGGTTYVKYKTTVSNQTYGNGEYVAWADSVWGYNAGATYGASEWPPSGAFDKLTATTDSQPGWGTSIAENIYNNSTDSSSPPSLYLKTPVAFVLRYYSIQARTDATYYTQVPISWKLYGSMDGKYWTLLDTQTSQSFTSGSVNTYYISNIAPYNYYQVKSYRIQSSSNSTVTIGEVRYYGIPYPYMPMSGLLEFPPTSIPLATTWTKDLADTIVGLGSVTYCKYKYTVSNVSYGNGEYIAWANSVWNYSATSGYGASECPVSGAFDKYNFSDNVQSGWSAASADTMTNASDSVNPVILYFKSPISFVLKYYTLTARSDAAAYTTPYAWTIFGSVDGNTWVTIDTRATQSSWTTSETRGYVVANTSPYMYYRMNIVRVDSASPTSVCIGDLKYYGSIEMPTDGAVLEFPPPMAIVSGNQWTKDRTETVSAIGSQSALALPVYKYVVSPTFPYGTGEYQAWANTIASYNDADAYGANEWCPSGAFDKRDCYSNSNTGWASYDSYSSTADASPAPELYIKLPTKIFLTQYNIKSNSDTGSNGSYNPIKWKVWGSNDGTTWTLIDYIISDTNWSLGTERSYATYSSTPFQYYKITCLRVKVANAFVIGEWRLFGIMYNVGLNTTQPAILEYPPPVGIGAGYQWTKDITDTVNGLECTYCKYKYTVDNTVPYGQGQYITWANTIYSGDATAYLTTNYGSDEWAPSGMFDKRYVIGNSTVSGWHNNSNTLIMTYNSDSTTPFEVYIKIPQNIMLIAYSFTPRADNNSYYQCPSKWTLFGSINGTNWIALDIRTTEVESGRTYAERFFTCSRNLSCFNHFKLVIFRNSNSISTGYISIGEWRLFGIPQTNTTNLEVLEYPPVQIGKAIEWTKDTADTLVGLNNTAFCRYKYYLNGAPYGNGQYIAWANSVTAYTASTSYGTNEWPACGAFDKQDANTSTNSGWAAAINTYTSVVDATNPPELCIQLPQAIMLKYYLIRSRIGGSITQSPFKWEVYGSIDGSTWMKVDSRSNEANWSLGESRTYTIDRGVTTYYNYYKMIVYRNNHTTGDFIAFGDWRLYGSPADADRMLEFPPPDMKFKTIDWTQDTSDQVTSIDANTYYKYKTTAPSAHPYGSGEYASWANTSLTGWASPALFDQSIGSNYSYVTHTSSYTNAADANPAPEVFLRLPVAISLRSYIIMGRNDSVTGTKSTQVVSKWNLYGTNDEVTWTLLDSRSDETNWSIAESRFYICNNSTLSHLTAFKTFKLTLLRNNSASSQQIIFGKWRLFGVPQISTSSSLSTYSFKSIMQDVHMIPDNIYSVLDISGMIAWYKGETWTGSQWKDVSGSGNHITTMNNLSAISTARWGTNGMKYVYGSSTSGMTFPAGILPTTYTLFHVAKFNGSQKGRIFDGTTINWLSGFWAGRSGMAYHNPAGWITATTDLHGSNWVVSSDQNNLYRSQGVDRLTSTPTTGGSDRIAINNGAFRLSDSSDWAVAEVLVYNRTLTLAEIQTVETYLLNKWYNNISIFTQSPSAMMSMPDWYALQNDTQTMPGMVGWYKGETWSNGIWYDASGTNNHCTITKGNISVAPLPEKNGLTYIYGDTSSGITFPNKILPYTYTLFYVAKHNGVNKARIFDGLSSNWFSGFDGAGADTSKNIKVVTGSAYHGSYIAPIVDYHGNEWVIGCDQKNMYRSNGVTRGYITNGGTTEQLTINYGYIGSSKYSDWAVAEVIVFDRELNLNAIMFVENYLMQKYTVERVIPLPTVPGLKNSKAAWKYNMMDITNLLTTYQSASRSSSTLTLTTANGAMSYGCAVFPFNYTTPGNVYTIESEVLINSTDAMVAKNALWLSVGSTLSTNAYSTEYDTTGGYNLVTTVNSDFSSTNSANTFDIIATNYKTYNQPAYTTGMVIQYTFYSVSGTTVTNTGSSGATNNGTFGGSNYYLVSNIPFGKGVQVTNASFYLTIGTAIATSTVSGACWYYFDKVNTGSGWNTIFCYNGGTYHHMLIQLTTNLIGFYWNGSGNFVSSGIALIPGKWYHLAFTASGSNYVLYINGIKRWSSSSFFNNSTSGRELGIVGNYAAGFSQGALGILADVRIFNTQIGDADVLDIYNRTSPFEQALVSRTPLNKSEVRVPPAPMTANTTTISSASYGNGTYIVSASSTYTGYSPWNAFTQNTANFWPADTNAANLYNTTTGAFTGTTSTTLDIGATLGEWIQIQTPYAFRLNYLGLTGRQDSSVYLYRSPNTFYVAGSLDGSTWTTIAAFSKVGDWTASIRYFQINCPTPYTYFRIITTILGNNIGTTNAFRNSVNLSGVDLYGHFDNITNPTYSPVEVQIPSGTLTATTTDLSSAPYAKGTYITSASSVYGTNTYPSYEGFTINTSTVYASVAAYNSSTGAYTGAFTTTISGSSYSGEWLQIQLPYKLKLTRYEITPRPGTETSQSPNTWKIAGSNDGTTWYLVDTQTTVADWSSTNSTKSFVVNSTIPYKYFRMVCNVTGQTGDRSYFVICIMKLFGYTEQPEWKIVRHYVDLNKRRFRMTVPCQQVDVSADIPANYLTNTGTQLGFAARTDTHVGNFQLRFCKLFSGWQDFGPLHMPYIDLDAMNLTKLQPGVQIGIWRNNGFEGCVSDAVAYTDGTSKPTYQLDAMGQPYVHFERSASQYFMIPGTLRFLFRADDNTGIGGYTVISVMRFTGTVGNYERVFDFLNKPAAANGNGNNIILMRYSTSTKLNTRLHSDTALVYDGYADNTIDSSWHTYCVRTTFSTTSVGTTNVWVDGQQYTTTSSTPGNVAKFTTTYNYIGKSAWNGNAYLNADMRELLVYRMPLSDETIGNITAHLQNKWKLWKRNRMCVCHFDASYLGTVAGISIGSNITTWKNLGDDNVIVDATGYGFAEYPPAALSAASTNVTGQSYGNGTYILSASTVTWNSGNVRDTWFAFDKNWSRTGSTHWGSDYQYSMLGVYTGAQSTTVSGTPYAGEWLQIQLPNSIILHRYDMMAYETIRNPGSFVLAGSTNGSTWTLIDTQLDNIWTPGTWKSFSLSANTTSYNYYRIITTVAGNSNETNYRNNTIIEEWKLFTNARPTLALNNGFYNVNFNRTYSQYFQLNGSLDFNGFMSGTTPTNGMTIICVAQLSTGGEAASWERLFEFGNGPNSDNINIGRYSTTNQFNFEIRNGSSIICTGWPSVDLTAWHMYTITFTNATNFVTSVYIDGQLVSTATSTAAITNRNLTTENYIGKSAFGNPFLQGNIRELIMYRTALSSTELANLHTTLIKKWGLTETPPTPIYKICHFDAFDLASSVKPGAGVSSWTNKANDVMVFPSAALTATSTNLSSASWGKGTYTATASSYYCTGALFPVTTSTTHTDTWTASAQTYGNGTYTTSQSSTLNGAAKFCNAFDASGNYYQAGTLYDSSQNGGVYLGTTVTTAIGYHDNVSVNLSGEWAQIQLPVAIYLNSYTIKNNSYWPKTWYVLGSVDGTNWYWFDTQTATWSSGGVTQTFTVTKKATKYNYYRFVWTVSGSTTVSIETMQLYGCDETHTHYSDEQPWRAFDKNYVTGSGQYSTCWSTGGAMYDTGTGAYIGTKATTISGTSRSGEWLQIVLPQSIMLKYYSINALPTRACTAFYLAGSTDGITWTQVDTRSALSWGATEYTKTFDTSSNTTSYTYYRLLIQSTVADASGYTSIGHLDLYGYHEGVFPPVAMTNYSSTVSSQVYGNGVYTASASTEFGTGYVWNLFDFDGAGNNWWSNAVYTASTGVYSGTLSTVISGTSYSGEWVQIAFPVAIKMTKYDVKPKNDSGYNCLTPTTWYLAGSLDGNTWTLLDSRSGITWADYTTTVTYVANATSAYSYYRMVITVVGNSDQTSTRTNAAFTTLNIYGIVPFTLYAPSAFNATQGTTANQPTLQQEDGLYHVNFVRANSQFLQISASLDFNTFMNNATAQNGLTAIVVGRMTDPNTFERFFDFANGTNNNNIMVYRQNGGPLLNCMIYNNNSQSYSSIIANGLDGSWHIYSIIITNSATPSYQSYFDGNLVSSGTTSTAIINRTLISNYIGRSNNTVLYLEGGIRELIIYKQALTSADLSSLHWSLMKKWRIFPTTSLTRELTLTNKPLHFDANDLAYSFGLTENSSITTWRNLGTDGVRLDATAYGANSTKPTLYKENNMWYVRASKNNYQYFNISSSIPFDNLQDTDGSYTGGVTMTSVVRIGTNSVNTNYEKILHMCTSSGYENLTNSALTGAYYLNVTVSSELPPDGITDTVYSLVKTGGAEGFTNEKSIGTYNSTVNVTVSGYFRSLSGVIDTQIFIFKDGNSAYTSFSSTTTWQRFSYTRSNITGAITYRIDNNNGGELLVTGIQAHISSAATPFVPINTISMKHHNSLVWYKNGTEDKYSLLGKDGLNSTTLQQHNVTNNQNISDWHVVTWVIENNATPRHTCYVDGNPVLVTSTTNSPLCNRIFTNATFCAGLGASDMDMRELIVYRNALSAAELNSLHTQLMNKWAITKAQINNNLTQFPPTLSANSSYVAGIPYVVTASTEYTGYPAWQVFDSLGTSTFWYSNTSTYDSSGNSTTTPALGTDDAYGGEWVQIKFSYGVIPSYYILGGYAITWRVYGNTSQSWEAANWVNIDERTLTSLKNYEDFNTYQIANASSTRYFAFAIKVKKSAVINTQTGIHSFMLYGTQPVPYNVFSPSGCGYISSGDDIGNWDIVYATTTATRDINGNIVFTQRNVTNYSKPFNRVAYFMQNNMGNGNTTYWAFTSFDAWNTDVTTYRLPSNKDAFAIERQVLSNMNVYSNHPQVTNISGTSGYLNTWPYNYGPGSGQSTFNYLNTPAVVSDGHGAFQVYAGTTPVMCWNKHRNGSTSDVGFGNNDASNIHYASAGHPNWTFAGSGAYNFKLIVMVRQK